MMKTSISPLPGASAVFGFYAALGIAPSTFAATPDSATKENAPAHSRTYIGLGVESRLRFSVYSGAER